MEQDYTLPCNNAEWNRPFPSLFEEIAKNYKNNNALAFASSDDYKALSYRSYKALNERANQLAHYLMAYSKLGPGKLVGILVSDMVSFIECLLAVWKTGAAYVPISLTEEKNVIKEIITNSQPDLCLTAKPLASNLTSDITSPLIIISETENQPIYQTCSKENPKTVNTINSNDLAYVMYTSGTTGKPKGAAILHRGIPYTLKAHQDILELNPSDRIAQLARVGFDASLMEILMALGSGACLYIVPSAVQADAMKFNEYFNVHEISQAIVVPSRLQTLESPEKFPKLRGLIVTGEKFKEALIQPWHNADKIVVNGYGLTETTICTTLGRYTGLGLSAGTAIKETHLYIVHPHEGELAPGTILEALPLKDNEFVEGELYIAGMSIALGYRHDIERTQQRFVMIKDPKTGEHVRAYRSGDICKLSPDGEIKIKRRVDNQLKLRGQRLEPEHIEAKLLEYKINGKQVIQNACVVGVKINQDQHLVAYVVLASNLGISVRLEQIRDYLKQHLPGFMIPNAWAYKDTLPLTDNGKINRRALSGLRPIPFLKIQQGTKPKTGIEKTLAKTWGEILDCDANSICREDDFLSLGGSSIKVTPLLKKLQANFQANLLKDTEIYNNSTLHSMAALCSPSSLKLLAEHPTRSRVYFIHSLLGDGWSEYQQLINHIPFQCYGFRARGLDDTDGYEETLIDLAKTYVKELIKSLGSDELYNHETPLILVGWSSGGAIALEMARQLKAHNYKNIKTIYLDAELPRSYEENDVIKLGCILSEQLLGQPSTKLEFKQKYLEYIQRNQNQSTKDPLWQKLTAVFNYLNDLDKEKSTNKTKELAFAKRLWWAEHCYGQEWQLDCVELEKIKFIFASHSNIENDEKKFYSDCDLTVIQNTHHFNLVESISCARKLNEYFYELEEVFLIQDIFKQLKQKYSQPITRKQLLTDTTWKVTDETYCKIQLVEEEKVNIEDTFKPEINQKNKEYETLFDIDGVCLIQGVAGSGKTLLTEYLVQRWAKGHLWQNQIFDIVLHIPLRRLLDPALGAMDLAEIIYLLYFSKKTENKVQIIKSIKRLLDGHKYKIGWILDGFDEVVTYYQAKDNSNSVKILLKHLLQQKHVIITARPDFSSLLAAKNILLNKGFNDAAIKQYINNFFNDSTVSRKFISWHRQHSSIDVLSNPIVLELSCNLWQSNNMKASEELATSTDLYSLSSFTLLSHHWQHRCNKIHKYPHLQSAIRACLAQLAYTAIQAGYRGFIPGELLNRVYKDIIDQHDAFINELKNHSNVPYTAYAALTNIGLAQYDWLKYVENCPLLLQVKNGANVSERAYQFIHLSFQEYLAAEYLFNSINKPNLPSNAFEEISTMVNDCKETGDHEAILVFLAGRLKKEIPLLETYMDIILNEPNVAPAKMSTDKTRLLLSMICWEETQLALIRQQDTMLNAYKSYFNDLIRFTTKNDFINSLTLGLLSVFCGIVNRCFLVRQKIQIHLPTYKSSNLNPRQMYALRRLGINYYSVFKQHCELIQQLLNSNIKVDNEIFASLLLIGKRTQFATKGLIDNLKCKPFSFFFDYHDEQRAAELLLQNGKERELIQASKEFIQLSNSEDFHTRHLAINHLLKHGQEQEYELAIKGLVENVKTKDSKIRQEAVKLLLKHGQEQEYELAIKALVENVNTKDSKIRQEAIEILLSLHHKNEVIAALKENLYVEDSKIRQEAVKLLLKHGQEQEYELAIKALVENVNTKGSKIRQEAIEILLSLHHKNEVITALKENLYVEDSKIRQQAAMLIFKYGNKDEKKLALHALIAALKSRNPYTRQTAEQFLSQQDVNTLTKKCYLQTGRDITNIQKEKAQTYSVHFFNDIVDLVIPPAKKLKLGDDNYKSNLFNDGINEMNIDNDIILIYLIHLATKKIAQDDKTVRVIFGDLNTAQDLQNQLFNKNSSNSNKMDIEKTINSLSQDEYEIILSSTEYDEIMGVGAFEALLLGTQPSLNYENIFCKG